MSYKRSLLPLAVAALSANAIAATEFYGLVEFEAGYLQHSGDQGETTSDLTVATVEAGVDIRINQRTQVAVSFLYEENDTPLEIDQAILTWKFDEHSSFALGQTYLPFGSFETSLVNDTLVLELAEIRETAIVYEYTVGGLSASTYLFNGDTGSQRDTIDSFGVHLAYQEDAFSAHIDVLNNMYESEYFASLAEYYNDAEAGLIIGGHYDFANITVRAEYLTWLQEDPNILHTELAYQYRDIIVAVAVQATNYFENSGLPKSRLSLGANRALSDATRLAFELWHDEDYAVEYGGSGESSTGLVIQLAAEF